ncbi:hypothetical protein BASA50_003609 [Batrachochytrium salamandrivorans]|uniref:Helicase C-terminal domain-containing protein n=1 Tax=Batrachochytrium salamandrivorans TaxID=1357716 RepID=A0ABQ8FID0_9FUNG|nr:hypothetical protein BASA50_003609 [Batrachochytrium salamandrivorans]KAH6600747.1 hypothetical protein BASA61_002164 [Batrachochytrium salamandrivorans]
MFSPCRLKLLATGTCRSLGLLVPSNIRPIGRFLSVQSHAVDQSIDLSVQMPVLEGSMKTATVQEITHPIKPISLRPYQEECIVETLKVFNSGIRRTAVSMPVGSGKTVIFANMIPRISPPHPEATKTLVLAHREELLTQAHNQISRYCPSLSVSIDQGTAKASMESDVIVASVQSIGRMGSARIKKYDPKLFKCIIIGTLRRSDGKSLHPTFLSIAYAKPITSMISDGWLSDVDVKQVKTHVHLTGVKSNSASGDYDLVALSNAVNTPERNLTVAQLYLNEAVPSNRKSTLVFAVNVQHIEDLVKAFKAKGVPAIGVHGKTPLHARHAIMKEFSSGRIPVLINCGIITEGVDIPRVDCVMLARPTKSGGLLQQMLGRGMRKFEGKERCIVFDFVDTITRGFQSATIPTLFGLSSTFDMEGKTIKEISDLVENINGMPLGQSAMMKVKSFEELKRIESDPEKYHVDSSNDLEYTLKPFLDPFSLSFLAKDNTFVRALTHLAWVRVGQEKWVIAFPSKEGLVVLERKSKIYVATYMHHSKKSLSRHLYKLEILRSDSISHAFKGADTFISEKLGQFRIKGIHWNAAWRHGRSTERQMEFARSMGLDRYVDIEDLTKGQMMDLLLRRQFGALGASRKANIEQRALEKLANSYSMGVDKNLLFPTQGGDIV